MHGLIRVRQFTLSEGHLMCTPEQLEDEFRDCLELAIYMLKTLGLYEDVSYRFSQWDPEDKEKYYDDDKMWDEAENKLREVLNSFGVEYFEAVGEAAFYGPKLDVEVKPAIGPEVTLSTCQLDFLLPRRFELSYINSKGEKETPVVLHRAIFGTFDRFTAFIIEETKGRFPTWLSPMQVKVIPVNPEFQGDYGKEIKDYLAENGVRVELDDRNEKLGYRLREAQTEKVPYTLILGDNEKNNNEISYRLHGEKDTTTLPKDEFLKLLLEEINSKANRK